MRLLEVCVDSFESALKAARSGADRLELCQDLSVGGLTPTAGFVKVIKELVSIPVFVLIRPRPGDFQYNTYEVRQMLEDIQITKQVGADGLVFGALNKENEIDVNVCQQLIAAASSSPVTFHRAFDGINNKIKALEDIVHLGFQRILTSGCNGTASEGVKTLQELVLQANNRIIIMPGGDVSDDNILHILQQTGAIEFHSSGRLKNPSSIKKSDVCCEEIIKSMKKIIEFS